MRLAFFSLLLIAAGAAISSSGSSNNKTAESSAHPADSSSRHPALPVAEKKPVAEEFHGTRVIDNYRWLEDGASAPTQKWVAAEMGYTRSVLDPLPGRDAIHQRLTELLSIGNIGVPQVAGRYYFYT